MMPNIKTKTRKGKLIKINGKWFVGYISESAGENKWHNRLPIYDTETESEQISDLLLVQKFNKPVCDLEQLEVEWSYAVGDGVTNFGYEYAVLL